MRLTALEEQRRPTPLKFLKSTTKTARSTFFSERRKRTGWLKPSYLLNHTPNNRTGLLAGSFSLHGPVWRLLLTRERDFKELADD
jgi:hypothetical protein